MNVSTETESVTIPVREPTLKEGTFRTAPAPPEQGIALALSGGGFRAMLFHVGSLWRLKEVGLLGKLRRVSSVSGGSITSALLAIKWNVIDPESADTNSFVTQVVEPLRELANLTIDVSAVGFGVLNPFKSTSDVVAQKYREYLFGDATLQDLPQGKTRFIITATSVQTGVLWRFSRPYMGDYRVGLFSEPKVDVATAVAASSAFPPFLSPLNLDLTNERLMAETRGTNSHEPYTSTAVLTDGGVYDNLGIEPIWKRFDTILVSDGGRAMALDPDPHGDWPRHSRRLIDLLQSQISSLRRRQLMESFERGKQVHENNRQDLHSVQARWGCYWGIQRQLSSQDDTSSLRISQSRISQLAAVETRLAKLSSNEQEGLINWGYAACELSLRNAVIQDEIHDKPPVFPYSGGLS